MEVTIAIIVEDRDGNNHVNVKPFKEHKAASEYLFNEYLDCKAVISEDSDGLDTDSVTKLGEESCSEFFVMDDDNNYWAMGRIETKEVE